MITMTNDAFMMNDTLIYILTERYIDGPHQASPEYYISRINLNSFDLVQEDLLIRPGLAYPTRIVKDEDDHFYAIGDCWIPRHGSALYVAKFDMSYQEIWSANYIHEKRDFYDVDVFGNNLFIYGTRDYLHYDNYFLAEIETENGELVNQIIFNFRVYRSGNGRICLIDQENMILTSQYPRLEHLLPDSLVSALVATHYTMEFDSVSSLFWHRDSLDDHLGFIDLTASHDGGCVLLSERSSTHKSQLIKISPLRDNSVPFENLHSGSDLILDPAFPNPFNSSMTIPYTAQKYGIGSIQLIDSFGRSVIEHYPVYFQTGTNMIHWEPNNIPSGSYFVIVNFGNYFKTQQIEYLK